MRETSLRRACISATDNVKDWKPRDADDDLAVGKSNSRGTFRGISRTVLKGNGGRNALAPAKGDTSCCL